MTKTAIVILNWNTKSHLETFLPFLIKYTTDPHTEIVLADNASDDDSVLFVQKTYPQIRIIVLEKNYGFAEGYNRALRQVNAQYYVILNSDIEVSENWLNPLIALLDENPSISACMPKLKSYFDRNSFEYAGAAGGYIDKYGYPFCKGRVFDTLEKDLGQYDGCYEVFWATGACMVIRSDVFHAMNGFDPYFFAHQEEIDLCWRMHNEGHQIFCTTASVVYHLGGGTLPKSNPRKTYLNFRNNLILLYKNLPGHLKWRIIVSRLVLDGIAGIKFLFGSNPTEIFAVIKAHFHFYRYALSHPQPKITKHLPDLILKKNIVLEYYLKKKKTWEQIVSQQ